VDFVSATRSATQLSLGVRISDSPGSPDFSTYTAIKGQQFAVGKKNLQLTYNIPRDYICYDREPHGLSASCPRSSDEYAQLIDVVKRMSTWDADSGIVKKVILEKLVQGWEVLVADQLRQLGRRKAHIEADLQKVVDEEKVLQQDAERLAAVKAAQASPPPPIEYYI
jgi:hypothetical protein